MVRRKGERKEEASTERLEGEWEAGFVREGNEVGTEGGNF